MQVLLAVIAIGIGYLALVEVLTKLQAILLIHETEQVLADVNSQ